MYGHDDAAADAVALMMDEHRLIEQVLDALEGFVEQSQAAGQCAELGRFCTFFRGYADAHHHGKEEAILFVCMEQEGYEADVGPLAVMRHEHREGRRLVGLLSNAAGEPRWDAARHADVAATAHGYARLLRRHIFKEDQILYPMAQSTLSEEGDRALQERVAALESDPQRRATAAQLVRLAHELVATYHQARPATSIDAPENDACADLCNRFDCVIRAEDEAGDSPWLHHQF